MQLHGMQAGMAHGSQAAHPCMHQHAWQAHACALANMRAHPALLNPPAGVPVAQLAGYFGRELQ